MGFLTKTFSHLHSKNRQSINRSWKYFFFFKSLYSNSEKKLVTVYDKNLAFHCPLQNAQKVRDRAECTCVPSPLPFSALARLDCQMNDRCGNRWKKLLGVFLLSCSPRRATLAYDDQTHLNIYKIRYLLREECCNRGSTKRDKIRGARWR